MKVCGSESTRDTYQERILAFGKYVKENHNLDLETLKDDFRESRYAGEREKDRFLDKLHDIVEDYVCFVKSQNYTTMHVKVVVSVVSSYLKKGCGIQEIDIDIPKRVFPQFHNRDITKDEIKKLLDHASLRDRTFFLMMIESGLRPSTLLELRYRYIKHDYEENIIPMKIELPSELLKDRIPARFTFIGEDGVRLLKEYLSTRKEIGDNDFIFLPERPKSTIAQVPSESAMSNKFNRLVLKLGIDTPLKEGKPKSIRLYNLRKYFFNNMKCDSAFRDYWFCHKTVDDHYISTQEDRHREEYMKGYKLLRIFEASEDVRIEALSNELEKTKKVLEDRTHDLGIMRELIDGITKFLKDKTIIVNTKDAKRVSQEEIRKVLEQKPS